MYLKKYSTEELTKLLSDVITEIKERMYHEGFSDGASGKSPLKELAEARRDELFVAAAKNSPQYSDELIGTLPAESIQQAIREARKYNAQADRDELIEKAKRDVAGLVDVDGFAYQRNNFGPKMVVIEDFVINREKRTVVVLGFHARGNRKNRALGIAKCDPSDCFNVHIGKAIALRRALGLEVPAEYMNAPQPTEVRVGDVIRWNVQGNITGRVDAVGKHVSFDVNGNTWRQVPENVIVIDDSRADAEQEVAD